MSGGSGTPGRVQATAQWLLLGLGLVACDPVELRLFEPVAVVRAPDASPGDVSVSLPDAGPARDAGSPVVQPPEPPDAAVTSCPVGPSGQCVDCLVDADCSPELPACDVARNVCVACVDDTYCGGTRPYCDVGVGASYSCNECVTDDQCSGAERCQFEADEPEEGLHCED